MTGGERVFRLLTVSLLVGGMANTVARERLFASLRQWLGGKWTWLGYLVSCAYCVSHWIALAVVPLTGSIFVDVAVEWGTGSALLRWFLSSVLVATVASFWRVLFYLVDRAQGLVGTASEVAVERRQNERRLRERLDQEPEPEEPVPGRGDRKPPVAPPAPVPG